MRRGHRDSPVLRRSATRAVRIRLGCPGRQQRERAWRPRRGASDGEGLREGANRMVCPQRCRCKPAAPRDRRERGLRPDESQAGSLCRIRARRDNGRGRISRRRPRRRGRGDLRPARGGRARDRRDQADHVDSHRGPGLDGARGRVRIRRAHAHGGRENQGRCDRHVPRGGGQADYPRDDAAVSGDQCLDRRGDRSRDAETTGRARQGRTHRLARHLPSGSAERPAVRDLDRGFRGRLTPVAPDVRRCRRRGPKLLGRPAGGLHQDRCRGSPLADGGTSVFG